MGKDNRNAARPVDKHREKCDICQIRSVAVAVIAVMYRPCNIMNMDRRLLQSWSEDTAASLVSAGTPETDYVQWSIFCGSHDQ